MNIFFGSVLLLFLLIPGYIYRKVYFTSIFSRKVIISDSINDIALIIIPSLIIHIAACTFIYLISDHQINYKILGNLLLNINDASTIQTTIASISANIFSIIIYNFSVWIIAICLGNLARLYVRRFRLDIKHKAFRFTNKYHYIFTGESIKFPGKVPDFDLSKIDFKYVDVLVNTGGNENILYSGMLFDYFLTDAGGLDAIVLIETESKFIGTDCNDDSKELKSTKLFITAGNIVDINLRYLTWKLKNNEDDLSEYRKLSINLDNLESRRKRLINWSILFFITALSSLLMQAKLLHIIALFALSAYHFIYWIHTIKKIKEKNQALIEEIQPYSINELEMEVLDPRSAY